MLNADLSLQPSRFILSLRFDNENLGMYEKARASMNKNSAFQHEGADWQVTKVEVADAKFEVFGVPYATNQSDWENIDGMSIEVLIGACIAKKAGNKEFALFYLGEWNGKAWRAEIGNTCSDVMLGESNGEFSGVGDTALKSVRDLFNAIP
jgi:hypothetical protein